MASGTPARSHEECLAGFGIAREKLVTGPLHSSVRRPDIGSGDPRFHERYDIAHLICAQWYGRHSQIGTAVPDYRSDKIAVLIVPDHSTANETWTVCAPIRIRTMAEPTRLRKLRPSPLDHGVGDGRG